MPKRSGEFNKYAAKGFIWFFDFKLPGIIDIGGGPIAVDKADGRLWEPF